MLVPGSPACDEYRAMTSALQCVGKRFDTFDKRRQARISGRRIETAPACFVEFVGNHQRCHQQQPRLAHLSKLVDQAIGLGGDRGGERSQVRLIAITTGQRIFSPADFDTDLTHQPAPTMASSAATASAAALLSTA